MCINSIVFLWGVVCTLALLQVCDTVLYPIGKTYSYDYKTEVRISDPGSVSKEVGVSIKSGVKVGSVWTDGATMLIQVTLAKPTIHSAARPHLSRDLKVLAKDPLFLVWKEGEIQTVYTVKSDPTLGVNIKKGVATLLQVFPGTKQRTESDVQGTCDVSYEEVEPGTIHKLKHGCTTSKQAGEFSHVQPIFGVGLHRGFKSEYKIDDDAIQSVLSIERHIGTVNLERNLSAVTDAWQEMVLTGVSNGKENIDVATLEGAIGALSKRLRNELVQTTLLSAFEVEPCDTRDCTPFEQKFANFRSSLANDKTATKEATMAFIELVKIARNSKKEEFLKVLKDEDNADYIFPLIDIIAATQTIESQEALMGFINFDVDDDITVQDRYLFAVAFSTHPSEQLLRDLLKLYNTALPSAQLRESVSEALGAVLYTYCHQGDQCSDAIVIEITEEMISHLTSCEDQECEAMNLRAMSNAGLPQMLPQVLTYAETSDSSIVCEAALKALRRMDRKHLLADPVREALKRIYHQRKQGYDTPVRTQALRLLLELSPVQTEIDEIAISTNDPYQTELDMFVQAFLQDQSLQNEELGKMIDKAFKRPELNNYHIMAPKGKSLAFTGTLADADGMRAAHTMYVENSRSGLMKRSGLDVVVETEQQNLPLYSFGIFAAGLEGMMGAELEPGEEDVAVTAGLALDMLDVSLRPVTFFTGQAGLMSAVWNAPAELTSALQANLLMVDHAERIPLQNGLILELDVHGTVSVDLSGSISISLWNKNCQSLIRNSGAVSLSGSLALRSPTLHVGVDFSSDAASWIDFNSDVDFYDKLKTCLQMSRPEFEQRHTVTKYEYIKGFSKKYTAKSSRVSKYNGVSYAFPPSNYAQCRELLVND